MYRWRFTRASSLCPSLSRSPRTRARGLEEEAKMAKEVGCWAAPIGGCGGGMTREHVVSKAILPPKVTIKGFFQEGDGLLTIGRDSLVSKCLCREHNNQLSSCDAEALRYRDVMRWFQAESAPDDSPLTTKT